MMKKYHGVWNMIVRVSMLNRYEEYEQMNGRLNGRERGFYNERSQHSEFLIDNTTDEIDYHDSWNLSRSCNVSLHYEYVQVIANVPLRFREGFG
jgi:hypothetical protein